MVIHNVPGEGNPKQERYWYLLPLILYSFSYRKRISAKENLRHAIKSLIGNLASISFIVQKTVKYLRQDWCSERCMFLILGKISRSKIYLANTFPNFCRVMGEVQWSFWESLPLLSPSLRWHSFESLIARNCLRFLLHPKRSLLFFELRSHVHENQQNCIISIAMTRETWVKQTSS